jgi:superfamily I DNA and/or RNA helicase
MLLKLLRTHRTLVCAPTNTALMQLASRLVSLLEESTETSHLLNDVIIFGSGKLTNNANDLSKISLDCRIRKQYSKYTGKNLPQHLLNKFLHNAKLVFCTPCSSFRFVRNQQFDNLVIDEAANLKECESLIPLAIGGIKHVVLMGDGKQLQSMVMSPVCPRYKTI